MIRIAVAEDSEAERNRLLRYLNRYAQEYKQQFDIQLYENGADIVSAYQPGTNILLLDIEMPVLDGMRTARILREKDKKVIIVFVTNLAQYAVQGYEVEALDFIVKPLEWNVFAFRMTRILSRLKRRQTEEAFSISIRGENGSVNRIEITDLLYVEINHHTLTYHTVSGAVTARGTMSEVEEMLTPQGFCRCNQGYLVNLRYVTAVEDENVLVGGEALRVSRAKKKDLMKALTNYSTIR